MKEQKDKREGGGADDLLVERGLTQVMQDQPLNNLTATAEAVEWRPATQMCVPLNGINQ